MKKLLLLSIFAACMPVISAFIITFFEQEFIEAIVSGLLIGCIVGSIVGIITLVLNKNRNKLITVFSVIPIFPLALYLMSVIPYFLHR